MKSRTSAFHTLPITAALAAFTLGSITAVPAFGQSYAATCTFGTYAGQPAAFGSFASAPGSADGTTGIVRFASLNGLAIDGAGVIYVADTASDTVRRISADGTVVSTYAGTRNTPGSQDGPGAQAGFNGPLGLAMDAGGNVYVADTGNDTIRIIAPGGSVSTLAGSPGLAAATDATGAAARFKEPAAVAVDSAGNVYVADTGNNTVRKITTGGVVTTLAGTAGSAGSTDGSASSALFSSPSGIAVDSGGKVYVADKANGSIRVIASGSVTTLATGLPNPTALLVDGTGNVHVVTTAFSSVMDGHTQAVAVVSPSGVVTVVSALTAKDDSSGGVTPGGIAIDQSGNTLVADPDSGMIRRQLAGSGVVSLFSGTDETTGSPTWRIAGTGTSVDGTVGTARFSAPAGIAVDAAGYLYVADTGNHTVRKVSANGAAVTTFAGVAGQSGSADGSGASARFNGPTALAIDAAGILYVADTGNQSIRKVSPSGNVSTLAVIGVAINSIAVDSAGTVYTTNTANDTVLQVSPGGAVSVLAGVPGVSGNASGAAAAARFNGPTAVAVDSAGNVYVYDSGSYTIRKISSGTVSTLAGGSTPGMITPSDYVSPLDGSGSAAQFGNVLGMTVDSSGNIFAVDFNEVREITPSGAVATLAGSHGGAATGLGVFAPGILVTGNRDGTGSKVLFNGPSAIAVDTSGTLYVADTANNAIRRGVLVGMISIQASPQGGTVFPNSPTTFSVTASGTGTVSYQWYDNGVAIAGATSASYTILSTQVTDSGAYTVVVSNSIGTLTSAAARLLVNAPPVIAHQPQSQTVPVLTNVNLAVSDVPDGNDAIQWYYNGAPIAGATGTGLPLNNIGSTQAGNYWAVVTNSFGSTTSSAATVAVTHNGRLANLSSRAAVGSGNSVLIVGFSVAGSGSKPTLIRAVGPTLAPTFNLSGTLPQPVLTLFDGKTPTQVVAGNSGWSQSPTLGSSLMATSVQAASATLMQTLGAFSLPAGSSDSALVATLQPGLYTSEVSGAVGSTGIALGEVYDANTGSTAARITNLSARGNAGWGANTLIGGFVVGGTDGETLLIRAVGPGLTSTFGISPVLPNPTIDLYDSHQPQANLLATQSGWGTAVAEPGLGVQPATASLMQSVGAFRLVPGAGDAAFVVTVPPGAYTISISNVEQNTNITGIVLIEIYEIP